MNDQLWYLAAAVVLYFLYSKGFFDGFLNKSADKPAPPQSVPLPPVVKVEKPVANPVQAVHVQAPARDGVHEINYAYKETFTPGGK